MTETEAQSVAVREPLWDAGVRLEDVTRVYGAGEVAVHALKGIDLTIGAGEFVVFLGPSGSGKTTLLNIIGGIDSPTSGRVIVGGEDIGRFPSRQLTEYRRRTVGFVFQFFNLIPTLTACENVELIADLTGSGRSDSADLLRAVGLGNRLDHFPAALSGGEQQRVAIARALGKNPSILLCDEPTGALDLDTGRQVLAVLRSINRERGCTTLVVTHNNAIAAMADRVLTLRSGLIEEDRRVVAPIAAEEIVW